MNSVPSDRLNLPGFPIRKSTDQRLFAASRGLSQLITPFIACPYQGIHHELYLCLTPTILHVSQRHKYLRCNTQKRVYTPLNALACSVCNTKLSSVGCGTQSTTVLHRAVRMTFQNVKRTTPKHLPDAVELVGFEPTTSCLQSRCSTN